MALVLGHSAQAATDTWTGNTSANWSVADGFNTVPSSGDTLVFGAAGAAGTTLNNDLFTSASSTVVGPFASGAIVFNAGAPAYTINGGAFELGTNSNFNQNGAIFNNSSNVQTINSNLTSLAYNFYVRAGTVAFGGTNTFSNADIQGGATMIVTGTTTTDVGNAGGTYAGAPIIGDGGGGAGTLTVAATGTLNVNGAPDNGPTMLIGQNGAAGTLNLNGGAINVNARTAIALGNSNGIGTLTINSGTMTVTAGSAFTFGAGGGGNTQTLNLNGGTLATGRAFVTGNTGADNFVLNGGTLQALASQTNWIATGITVTAANASTSTIDANNFAVTIASGISGTGGLKVTDSSTAKTGVVTLSGTNTYSGATAVNGGTLLINGNSSGATGPVSVVSGATLGGSGNVGGAATINGTVAPGSAGATIGMLTLTSTSGATISGTGIYLADLNATTGDNLTLSGKLTIASGATLTFNSLATPTAASYALADYTSEAGTFNVTNLPSGYMLQYGATELDLVVAVPEPSTWIGGLVMLGALGLRLRRRAASVFKRAIAA